MGPIESTQYEAGVKYDLTEGALLTAAVFSIDKGLEDIDGSNTYVQNGRQIHDGLALPLSGQATRDLRLIGAAAWLDAPVDKTADTSLIGKRPQGVPEWQANLYADYNLSRVVPGLGVNVGLYYGGEKPIEAENTWYAESWTPLDLGVSYEHRIGAGRLVSQRGERHRRALPRQNHLWLSGIRRSAYPVRVGGDRVLTASFTTPDSPPGIAWAECGPPLEAWAAQPRAG
jgi:iron complex outermembrane receptor protein